MSNRTGPPELADDVVPVVIPIDGGNVPADRTRVRGLPDSPTELVRLAASFIGSWLGRRFRLDSAAMNRTAQHLLPFAAIAVAMLVAGCAVVGDATEDASPSNPQSPVMATPTTIASHRPTSEPSGGVADVLAADAFAQVVAESVNVRNEPGLDAPKVGIGIPDSLPLPALLGTKAGSEHVYILEGPVEADGFEWFRVAPIEYEGFETVGPLFIGWMASGDGVDPWLVPENPCPTRPLTLEDLTYTSTTTDWATRLGCFRGQELTLSGWYPELPPGIGFEAPGPCATEPAFFFCGYAIYDIRPIEMSFEDERNANRLDFVVNPDSGLVLPPRGQWIEITGHWDDPASALCPTDTDLGTLSCRIQFVISGARPLGAES